MTGGAEKTLSDEAIVGLLDLGATVEWTQPRDTTAQHLLFRGLVTDTSWRSSDASGGTVGIGDGSVGHSRD